MTSIFRLTRRQIVTNAVAAGVGLVASSVGVADDPAPSGSKVVRNRFAVATYSFWQFRPERVEIETCLDAAAEMGFDGVEILHRQMREESNGYLRSEEHTSEL